MTKTYKSFDHAADQMFRVTRFNIAKKFYRCHTFESCEHSLSRDIEMTIRADSLNLNGNEDVGDCEWVAHITLRRNVCNVNEMAIELSFSYGCISHEKIETKYFEVDKFNSYEALLWIVSNINRRNDQSREEVYGAPETLWRNRNEDIDAPYTQDIETPYNC